MFGAQEIVSIGCEGEEKVKAGNQVGATLFKVSSAKVRRPWVNGKAKGRQGQF